MICHVELLFDSLTMSNHFQRNHNFTIEEYLEAYLNKYKQASPPSESDWMERCLYYCNLCLKVYKGKHGFKQHIITEHSLTGIEQQLGNCVLEETTHVCQAISVQGQVCGKEVIWCQKSLAQHLNKQSSLSLKKVFLDELDGQMHVPLQRLQQEIQRQKGN